MNDGLSYADLYFYQHNVHCVDVLKNMFADVFGTYTSADARNMTVKVFGVDLCVMRNLISDLGLSHMIHDVDYGTDYDYNDSPVDDTRYLVLYCNHNLYDLDDL